MTSEALKACPFCGSAPVHRGADARTEYSQTYGCENFSCPVTPTTEGHTTEEQARLAWNSRPSLPAAARARIRAQAFESVAVWAEEWRDRFKRGYERDFLADVAIHCRALIAEDTAAEEAKAVEESRHG